MTTNYQRHFFTPIRAAEWLSANGVCVWVECETCPIWDGANCGGAEKWLEWLESEEE